MMWPARTLSSAWPATRSAVAVHCRYQPSRSPSSIREVVAEISPSGHPSRISGRRANSSNSGSSKKMFLVTSLLLPSRRGCKNRRDGVSHNLRRLLSYPGNSLVIGGRFMTGAACFVSDVSIVKENYVRAYWTAHRQNSQFRGTYFLEGGTYYRSYSPRVREGLFPETRCQAAAGYQDRPARHGADGLHPGSPSLDRIQIRRIGGEGPGRGPADGITIGGHNSHRDQDVSSTVAVVCPG